mgnify:FL=1
MTLRRVPFPLACSCAGFLLLAAASLVLPDAWRVVPLVGLVFGASCYAVAWGRLVNRRAERLARAIASVDREGPLTPAAIVLVVERYETARELDYATAVVDELVSGDPIGATARAARLCEHVEARKSGRQVKR